MNDLSNYSDGSDRQVIRAVAAACGWTLERITETSDFHVRRVEGTYEDMVVTISIQCDYHQDEGDVYTRQLLCGALRSDAGTHSMWDTLANTIEMLRGHQRLEWRLRLLNAKEDAR